MPLEECSFASEPRGMVPAVLIIKGFRTEAKTVADLASQTKVDRTTVVNSHKDITNNQLEHSRPTVDCYIKSIKVTALLDACSTGPTSYVVNYIHPNVVEKIRKLEQDSKKKIIYECTCPRATTCTPAGCFETATCVTVDVQLSDLQSKTSGKSMVE